MVYCLGTSNAGKFWNIWFERIGYNTELQIFFALTERAVFSSIYTIFSFFFYFKFWKMICWKKFLTSFFLPEKKTLLISNSQARENLCKKKYLINFDKFSLPTFFLFFKWKIERNFLGKFAGENRISFLFFHFFV